MDESTLGVHQIELLVHTAKHVGDGRIVGEHAHSARDLSHLASLDLNRRLVVDSALEASRAPVHELHSLLVLHRADSAGHVLGSDITAVHQAAGHELATARIALAHHAVAIEHLGGDLGDRHVLHERSTGSDHGSVGGEHEVNTRVGHQVGLELVHIHVQRTAETQRGGHGGDDLGDETVEVGVGRSLDAEVVAADVIDSLVVKNHSQLGVLKQVVGTENGVVGLHPDVRKILTYQHPLNFIS